ncbi:MAG TPA: phenylalanine--tRNA ligase subunit beta [Gemmataceae bacterium]|jgi:phenylalanyl-tRNA synthetase beta chain|nr:phenylalanine--tRNA ligase subunit beta [Gemmataceae bacterium]
MKIPLRWLRDYIDVGLAVPQLAQRLTMAGLEVSGFRFLGVAVPEGIAVKPEELGPVWARDRIFVAEVLKVEKHPNADKLTLVTLNYGAAAPKTVVTGAPNLKPGDKGQKVILGLAGTVYWDGHVQPKQLTELKPKALRGIQNDAMVMSEFELGISEEHEGIIILEPDAPVGTPLVDFMGDVVLEIDVLPNMARCLSMIGMAREVAAITGKTIQYPDLVLQRARESIEGQVTVSIEDPKLSARYQAMLIRNVQIGAAPQWMQRRLTYAGMRPISNIVDITNYVMLEWGQPLHAFDYDLLRKRAGGKAPHIMVRPAREGEKLRTLDNQDRVLTTDMLVIADSAGPIALAGAMGGLETEVTSQTKNILLESASFDYVSIRRTMRALNLPSEASMRFSKGVHSETVKPAAQRAAEFMAQYAGGAVCTGEVDCYPARPQPQIIELPMKEVRRLLGMDFPPVEAERILKSLEFHIEKVAGDVLTVKAPQHRLDIQEGAADLIEDLARIHGYDRLPAEVLHDALPEQRGNRSLELEERMRDLLTEAGLTEAITYSMTTPERESPLTGGSSDYITILNEISSDRKVMRRTVLAGLLEVAANNLKHSATVRMFEVGPVYLPKAGEKLPDEPPRLALVLSGRRTNEFWAESAAGAGPELDFFDLKGVMESLAAELHLADVRFLKSAASWLHPGKAAEIVVNGKAAGNFGQLHPRMAQKFDLAGKTVLAAELDLDVLLANVPDRYRYVPVPKHPANLRDIAVVVEEAVTAERVQAELRAGGGELLAGLRLFDVYRGPSIPPGTKSLAYALTYQAPDRTLTDKEVNQAHSKIENRLKHVLKAQIRGK